MKLINQIIHQLGGERDVIVLITVILGLILINASIKQNILRLTGSIFSALFISAQVFSLYSTQSFVGYQFYIHMNLRGIMGMKDLFLFQLSILLVLFTFLALFNFYSYHLWKKVHDIIRSRKKTFLIQTIALLGLSSIVILEGNFIKDTLSLKSIFTVNDSANFEDILLKYNMSTYIPSDKIESSAGQNIIVISMESLERGFLHKKHAALTPNLNELKTKWNYLDINPNCGSSWTSGSLYTYLTGFPAFFGVHGNDAFKESYHSNISSISQLLHQSNYQTIYLNTDTHYSGVDNMLNAFQFDKIIDIRNTPKKEPKGKYGLRDKDLFSLAKSELETFKGSKTPYALFISTTDSHYPNGIHDKRMGSVIPPKTQILNLL